VLFEYGSYHWKAMCSVWGYVALRSALLPPYITMIELVYYNKAEFFLTEKI